MSKQLAEFLRRQNHGRQQQGGRASHWIFIHGTNIIDRGLKVLFSAFFCYFMVFSPLPPSLDEAK